ncbi:hypothetical protein DID77_04090 [Candidatus Marinamargulisbacteria bacterium SCGC AG-439-L15]|nr:hypothetical protein DID77_04090 [Candidatus Marinamargulisbacteria bacterium SCGC AG-439-L15]
MISKKTLPQARQETISLHPVLNRVVETCPKQKEPLSEIKSWVRSVFDLKHENKKNFEKHAAITVFLETKINTLLLENPTFEIDSDMDDKGHTLLYLCIRHQLTESVLKLIKKGSNPKIPNHNGTIPLDSFKSRWGDPTIESSSTYPKEHSAIFSYLKAGAKTLSSLEFYINRACGIDKIKDYVKQLNKLGTVVELSEEDYTLTVCDTLSPSHQALLFQRLYLDNIVCYSHRDNRIYNNSANFLADALRAPISALSKRLKQKKSPFILKDITSEGSLLKEESPYYSQKTIHNLEDLFTTSFCIGEAHSDTAPKRFLLAHMKQLKDCGFSTIFWEFIPSDNRFQARLDSFMTEDSNDIPVDIKRAFEKSEVPMGKEVLLCAKQHGFRFCGLESDLSSQAGIDSYSKAQGGLARTVCFNEEAVDTIYRRTENTQKWIVVVGNTHMKNYFQPESETYIKGIANRYSVPGILVRTSKNKEAQEADVTMTFSNIRKEVLTRTLGSKEYRHVLYSDGEIVYKKEL